MMYLSGIENLNKRGVWVFAKILVCFGCGIAQWTVPSELAQLAAGAAMSETTREEGARLR
jgi:hypothetical protein